MLARLTVLSGCLWVAACQTPADLKASPTAQTDRLYYPPSNTERLAACLQRRYESDSAFVSARLTPLGDGGYELVARADQTLTFAIFEIYPARLEYWVDPGFVPDAKATIGARIAACR